MLNLHLNRDSSNTGQRFKYRYVTQNQKIIKGSRSKSDTYTEAQGQTEVKGQIQVWTHHYVLHICGLQYWYIPSLGQPCWRESVSRQRSPLVCHICPLPSCTDTWGQQYQWGPRSWLVYLISHTYSRNSCPVILTIQSAILGKENLKFRKMTIHNIFFKYYKLMKFQQPFDKKKSKYNAKKYQRFCTWTFTVYI